MQDKIITQVIVIALLMLTGWGLSKKGIVTDTVNRGFSDMLMTLCLPALVLYSFCHGVSKETLACSAQLLIVSCAIHLSLILFCEIGFSRMNFQKKSVMKFVTAFSNAGFIGFPVLQGVFGSEGVLYASIFSIPMNVFMFSYGIMVFSGERNLKNVFVCFINLPFIATVAGIIIALLQIHFPMAVTETLQYAGNMAIPLSMFIVGHMISKMKLKDSFKGKYVYIASLIRLVVIPMVALHILKFFHVDSMVISVSIILVSMPAPTLVGMFADRFDGDKTLASQCIFVTTVLSVFTVPIVVSAF